MYETWYKMTAMIQSGVDISPVIRPRFPYDQFKQAIELMKSGNSGKIVVDWERAMAQERQRTSRLSSPEAAA